MVQMHGPTDFKRAPKLDPKTQLELQFFTESFGQANREFNEPKRGGSIIPLLADHRGREGGGEDLQWLLMNKMEFFFHR